MTLVSFAEWRPDVADLNNSVTADILNVMCADGSYIPFPKLTQLTDALPAKPMGGFLGRDLSGQITIFVGTAEKLYIYNNTSHAWEDVSKSATTYGATDDAQWCFTQFGNYVVAVNQNDNPQVYDLSASSEFRDLGGNPPRAGVVRVWGDFLCLMNLADYPNRVHWSELNNIEGWTPGTLNSDYQTFPDGGIVQGSSEATNPIIILERAIYIGTFVPGSTQIFTFQKIHDRRGASSLYSIAARGAYVFYADEGGFFQITLDGALGNIGFEKVDRTIFNQMAVQDIRKIRGVVDPFYSRVYFAVSTGASTDYDRVLVYDWNLQRWSQSNTAIVLHFPAATPGYTLDGLDAVSSSLDALPFSLDSKAWQGGAPLMAAFDADYRLCFFNGDAMEATLTTQETGDTGGACTLVKTVLPVVDTGSVHVAIGSRYRRSDASTWTGESIPSSNTGIVRKKSRGRFHKVKTRIDEGAYWTHAQGVDVAVMPMGQR